MDVLLCAVCGEVTSIDEAKPTRKGLLCPDCYRDETEE